jgi:hypothetical protein
MAMLFICKCAPVRREQFAALVNFRFRSVTASFGSHAALSFTLF